jgi:methylated-DNA-[protein]-cysteine S-methyltransferase
MTPPGFTLFATAIGRCGIAWGARGVDLVQLPEGSEAKTRARVRARCPQARESPPPAAVKGAMDGIVALLRGETPDLSAIALDMGRLPPFHRRVYEAARAIPPGATRSYGEVAAQLGAPGAARAVGQALKRNPFAIVVPCHRVLAASGKVGGFSADGGVTTKLKMLAIEGAQVNGAPAGVGNARALGFDPRVAVAHVRGSDAALARVIDAVGPFRLELEKTASIFAALSRAIVYQQLNGKAAATIFGRVCALFPRARHGPTAEQILDASDDALRGAGLSRSKALAWRDLARRTADGKLPTLAAARRMDDAAVIERLTEVRGIGRWTAEMLLIFHLGRPDVLPVDDYGVRKGFALAFKKRELPSRNDLERRGLRWKPYRTVASWYLWRAVELAQKPKPPAGAPARRA